MKSLVLPFTLAATVLSAPTMAQDIGFANVGIISTTMGVNDGRICTGEYSRGDIGCAANAPYISRTTGHVGIGTNTPSYPLVVSASTSFIVANTASTTFGGFRIQRDGDDVWSISKNNGSNDLIISRFNHAGIFQDNPLVINNVSGNLGVGTANPSTTLTVSGTTYTGFLQLDAKTGAAAPSGFQGGHWTASGTAIYYNGGNVGIGTSSPAAKLDLLTGDNTNVKFQGATGKLLIWPHYNYNGNYLGSLLSAVNAAENAYIPITLQGDPVLLNGGNVGIGTNYPTTKLAVNGNTYLYATPDINNAVLSIRNTTLTGQGDNNTHFGYNLNGVVTNFIRGTDTRVDGNLIVSGVAYKPGGGDWAASSDARLKNIDGAYTSGLDQIVALKPVRFHYRKDNPRKEPSDRAFVGLIAQDVKKVIPEAVSMRADGFYDLDATPISYAVINAIKELKAANDNLAKENDALRSAYTTDIKELRTELEALKRALPAAARH